MSLLRILMLCALAIAAPGMTSCTKKTNSKKRTEHIDTDKKDPGGQAADGKGDDTKPGDKGSGEQPSDPEPGEQSVEWIVGKWLIEGSGEFDGNQGGTYSRSIIDNSAIDGTLSYLTVMKVNGADSTYDVDMELTTEDGDFLAMMFTFRVQEKVIEIYCDQTSTWVASPPEAMVSAERFELYDVCYSEVHQITLQKDGLLTFSEGEDKGQVQAKLKLAPGDWSSPFDSAIIGTWERDTVSGHGVLILREDGTGNFTVSPNGFIYFDNINFVYDANKFTGTFDFTITSVPDGGAVPGATESCPYLVNGDSLEMNCDPYDALWFDKFVGTYSRQDD